MLERRLRLVFCLYVCAFGPMQEEAMAEAGHFRGAITGDKYWRFCLRGIYSLFIYAGMLGVFGVRFAVAGTRCMVLRLHSTDEAIK